MNWKLTTIIAALMISGLAWTANAADAKATWDKTCAKCHGKTGNGKTKMGAKLKIKDYSDAKVQASIKDEEMFKAIKEGIKKNGKTRMKAYGSKLSDNDIKALVAYVRKLKK